MQALPIDTATSAVLAAAYELPTKCAIILDRELPNGRLANACAVIALTIGQRHPGLVGGALVDATGCEHPGLIPIGITVLAASQDDMRALRQSGLESGCDIVTFPVQGQMTKNYPEFQEAVARSEPAALQYVGIALIGQKKAINKIVSKLALLS